MLTPGPSTIAIPFSRCSRPLTTPYWWASDGSQADPSEILRRQLRDVGRARADAERTILLHQRGDAQRRLGRHEPLIANIRAAAGPSSTCISAIFSARLMRESSRRTRSEIGSDWFSHGHGDVDALRATCSSRARGAPLASGTISATRPATLMHARTSRRGRRRRERAAVCRGRIGRVDRLCGGTMSPRVAGADDDGRSRSLTQSAPNRSGTSARTGSLTGVLVYSATFARGS